MFPPVSRPPDPGRSRGPPEGERVWRRALKDAGYNISLTSVPFHFTSLMDPRGDAAAAEAAYRAFAAAEPESMVALEGLLFLLRRRGRTDEAFQICRRIAALQVREMGLPEHDHEEAVAYLLAKAGVAPAPATMPPTYVATRFDDYADGFDRHVLETLHYAGHELVRDAVVAAFADSESDPPIDAALDLGCGTGLTGAELRPFVGRLDGVDLSPAMLELARERGSYDDLVCGDAAEIAAQRPRRYDLVVSADMFPYVGDLSPVFAGVAAALRPGGTFVFTVEAGEGDVPLMRGTGHYAHSREYVATCAAGAGFDVVACDASELRTESGEPLEGLCCVLRRDAT